MRYDTEHKAKTRETVLQHASAAIRLEGPHRIGVAAIMARAGLTHGGFYAHFKSKDDLIAEAIAYMFESRYTAFFTDLNTSEPRATLLRFIESYLSMRHRNAIDRGCPIPVLAGDVPRMPLAARAKFEAAVDRLTQGIATLLERLDVENPEARATSVLSEMIGALAVARLHSDEKKAEHLLDNARSSVIRALNL